MSQLEQIAKLKSHIKVLEEHFIDLSKRFLALQSSVNPRAIGEIAVKAIDHRYAEISKLTEDCTKILNFLCDEDLIDRQKLNEVVAKCQPTM